MGNGFTFKSTAEIKTSKKLVEQVIGQEAAVKVIKKAAQQRRHVLLIGAPGTGKSMLGLALAELLPKEKLVDVMSFPNPNDENQPLIRAVPGGQGREIVSKNRLEGMKLFKNQSVILFIVALAAMIIPWWVRSKYESDVMFAAFFLGGIAVMVGVALFLNMGRKMSGKSGSPPKVIVDNYGKKQAPFFDATGSHAGALLGDVLHDPFQSFSSLNSSIKIRGVFAEKNIHEALDKYWHNPLIHKEISSEKKDYEAVFLPPNELEVLGVQDDKAVPVEVMSSNRYSYDGQMIKVQTTTGKELVVTPEHKIAVVKQGKTCYVPAEQIVPGDEVVAQKENIIIDEQDIVNTYDARQQEQCRHYYEYLAMKEANPSWGYKRIAKSLGLAQHKTRWWHAKKHIPTPVQTIDWLKEKKLLPLKIDDSRLPLIGKILGTTFGDGGIFENLNGIFLSSSEKDAVEEFGSDLNSLFNMSANENARIIEGGEYGHSWCYQSTNRKIIRFFLALGAPQGNKTVKELQIPSWIKLHDAVEDEFFGSLFGNEMGVPKIHVDGNRTNTFDFALTGKGNLKENRIAFLQAIKMYLEKKQVKTNKLSEREIENNTLYRLMISTKFDNLINFLTLCKLNYCTYKKEKFEQMLLDFSKHKRLMYYELLQRGYGAEYIMKLLQITPSSLYIILNYEEQLGEAL